MRLSGRGYEGHSESNANPTISWQKENSFSNWLLCCFIFFSFKMYKAKSRKYQRVFKVKSRVKTLKVRGIWSRYLKHKKGPKRGTEPGVWKGKRSLLACDTRCKSSMETTSYNSVKVKLGVKVMKLVESLIGWEAAIGQGSECLLTFVRGGLHISE